MLSYRVNFVYRLRLPFTSIHDRIPRYCHLRGLSWFSNRPLLPDSGDIAFAAVKSTGSPYDFPLSILCPSSIYPFLWFQLLPFCSKWLVSSACPISCPLQQGIPSSGMQQHLYPCCLRSAVDLATFVDSFRAPGRVIWSGVFRIGRISFSAACFMCSTSQPHEPFQLGSSIEPPTSSYFAFGKDCTLFSGRVISWWQWFSGSIMLRVLFPFDGIRSATTYSGRFFVL